MSSSHGQLEPRLPSHPDPSSLHALLPFDPWRRVYAPLAAEFFASLLFTLFSDLLGVLLLDRASSLQDIALFEGVLTLALICAFCPISGAHFNPAITLASMLCLGTPILLGFVFLFAQFFGAFFGALLFHSTISGTSFIDVSLRFGTIRMASEHLAYLESADDKATTAESSNDFGGTERTESMEPFPNRFQIFLLECLCSSLLVLAHLFTSSSSSSQHTLCQAASVASARSVATAISARSPLGQSANLCRPLANAIMAMIFTPRPDEFAIWRFFYLHFFGAVCSAIVGSAIFWIIKCAIRQQQSAVGQRQNAREE